MSQCSVVTSRPCQLQLSICDNVTIRALKNTHPGMTRLELHDTTVLYETQEELIWLAKLTVEDLALAPLERGMLLDLAVLLQESLMVKNLYVDACKLHLCHFPVSQNKNNTLTRLCLKDCAGRVDLALLFQICSHCLVLDRLTVSVRECEMQLSDRSPARESVKQNQILDELRVTDCKGDVDLCLFLKTCSECVQLKKLTIVKCKLQLVDERVECAKPNLSLKQFKLLASSVHSEAGLILDEGRVDRYLRDLCPSAKIMIGKVGTQVL